MGEASLMIEAAFSGKLPLVGLSLSSNIVPPEPSDFRPMPAIGEAVLPELTENNLACSFLGLAFGLPILIVSVLVSSD